MQQLKEKIRETATAVIKSKLNDLLNSQHDIRDSIENETKSSAGDKHETARARMQAEQGNLARQQSELQKQLEDLERITISTNSETAFLGSLVQTSQGYFFIAVPLGKIKVEDLDIFVVSPQSPVGQLLIGLTIGAEFTMNETKYRILNLY